MVSKINFVFFIVFISFVECGNNRINQFYSSENSKVSSFEITDAEFVGFLKNYKDSKQVYVQNNARGGTFDLIFNKNLQDDYGITFPAVASGKGWHWVRQYAAEDPVNIQWYGAKGTGLAGYKDDSAAFVKAINLLKSKDGGKLYIPATSSFYGFNGDGILLPDNTEIYGDGPKSVIKHINPESAILYKGAIFYTTSYGPVDGLSIMRVPTFKIEDAKKNQNYVTLLKNSDSLKLQPGKLIGLGSGLFQKREQSNKSRFTQFEINEISKVESNKIYLKYPLSVPLKGGANPVLIDVNGNHTYNKKLKTYDRISKNIYIHDLTLAQADYNMVANKPYAGKDDIPPSSVIGLGGTFESKFQNITLDGFGSFIGNLWNRCDISNLKIYSVRKFTDLGYGSANTKMHDIEWIYKPTKIKDEALLPSKPGEVDKSKHSFIYLNDGTHDIEIYNVKAAGNWNGVNIFQIAGGAHHIYMHDITIDLPKFNSPKGVAINIRDDDALTFSHDIIFKNVSLTVGGLKQFLQIRGTNQVIDDKIIQFDNVVFNGNLLSKNAINITNSTGVVLNKVSVSKGDILLDNSASAKISNLDAPNSDIIDQNNKGKKSEVIASKYKSLKKS